MNLRKDHYCTLLYHTLERNGVSISFAHTARGISAVHHPVVVTVRRVHLCAYSYTRRVLAGCGVCTRAALQAKVERQRERFRRRRAGQSVDRGVPSKRGAAGSSYVRLHHHPLAAWSVHPRTATTGHPPPPPPPTAHSRAPLCSTQWCCSATAKTVFLL